MTSLRTIDGIDLNMLESIFGTDKLINTQQETIKWITSGHIIVSNNHIVLTQAGKLMADGIASDLFIV